ncbi:MAG: histone family protein DNA-binding protein [Bacillales bacterium]|nr:histone family protein DNA-binding protein [Bacillales bacterium]
MNKSELVAAMAEKTELSKKDSEKALKAFIDVVTEELTKGEKIQLVGFGTFSPKFKAGKALKDAVN